MGAAKPIKPVVAVRPVRSSGNSATTQVRPVIALRPAQVLARKAAKDAKRPAQVAEAKPAAKAAAAPDRSGTSVGERARRIAMLTQRIKDLQSEGKTKQANRVTARLEELKRQPTTVAARPKKGRSPLVAQRPVRRIANGGRLLALQLKSTSIPEARKAQIIRTAYLRTLTRYPDERETARAEAYLNGSDTFVGGLRDLVWALVNTREFIVNH
jgi:uncharacterized small protein (DUF1192 family)